MRVSLEWLKTFVTLRGKPERLAHRLTMGGVEVEEIERVGTDVIFELGLTPNRADCLSVMGVAREIAAVTGAPIKVPAVRAPRGMGKMSKQVRVSVRSRKRCPRYAARIIEGVQIGPSPSWMVKRLAAAGIRSINNVVDATNYVMLECGQPLHAFDLRFVRDEKLIIREAGKAMTFTTLDGLERKLLPEDLLICDGQGPVALAGIMGGENSEVRQSTTTLLLESAYFEPSGVRRTSRRLGLATESSRRFERGVDPNGVLTALHRLTEIICETAGGKPTADHIDLYPKRIAPKRVSVTVDEVNRILGTKLTRAQMVKCLKGLGFAVGAGGGKRLSVLVPTVRPDITRPIDLIEEVARIHGYDQIPETMPMVRVAPLSKPHGWKQEEDVRQALIDTGFTETVLYGFRSEEAVAPFDELGSNPILLTNPLSREQGVMQPTLVPGVLDVLRFNATRQRGDCRAFALQHVFHRPCGVGPCEEPRMVSGAMTGVRFPGAWERSSEMLDFYDAKGVVDLILETLGLSGEVIFQRGEGYRFLHPGRFAYILLGSKRVGYVGQLHPDVAAQWDLEKDVFLFECDFDHLADLSLAESKRYQEYSRFPHVDRDLAIVIDAATPAVEVERTIQDSGADFIEQVRIFDVYRGKGVDEASKSLGVSVRFSRNDGTLTDAQVDAAQSRILLQLQKKLGAQLRS